MKERDDLRGECQGWEKRHSGPLGGHSCLFHRDTSPIATSIFHILRDTKEHIQDHTAQRWQVLGSASRSVRTTQGLVVGDRDRDTLSTMPGSSESLLRDSGFPLE